MNDSKRHMDGTRPPPWEGAERWVDGPLEPRMVQGVLLPFGGLYLVLVLVGVPQMLALPWGDLLGLLVLEGMLLGVLCILWGFFRGARRELWVDPRQRRLHVRVVWGARILWPNTVAFDEVRGIQGGETVPRLLRGLANSYPLRASLDPWGDLVLAKLPSQDEAEALAHRLDQAMD